VPAVKLSFSDVLSEGFSFFFGRLRLFFHLVTIPWIVSVAIRLVGAALAPDSLIAVLVEKALDVVPTVMFMVAWQRVVLLGPSRVGRLPGLGWSPREWAYLVHLIKVAGVTFVLIGALVLTVGSLDPAALTPGAPLDPEATRQQAMAPPLAAGFIVSMLLALRVSYGLAATAVDVPFSPRLSWAHSRGNAWTVIAALLIWVASIIGSLGVIVCCVGLLFTIPYSVAIQAGIVTWYEQAHAGPAPTPTQPA